MERQRFDQENSSEGKGDGREKSQKGDDKPRCLNVIKEAAKQTEKTNAESSQERTQRSDGESSSPHDTEKEVQQSHMYQECLDMTWSARQDIFNDSLSVEELAEQVKRIANWLETHQICLPERTKTCLNKIWKDFHNKSFYDQCVKRCKIGNYEYVKRFMSKNIEGVKKHIRDFLWEVDDLLRVEKVKDQTSRLEDAINLITSHREEFEKIGYNYKKLNYMQQEIENFKNKILTSCYFSIGEEAYFKAYCQTIFKMSRGLEGFLKIDADWERKKVLERENHIQELLEALPKVRPVLSNLPREQWWKLYIDAPMHQEAQKDRNPGHFFDQGRSPGYQQSMLDLFEKVLVPAQNRNSKSMNYEDYTEMHKVATEYIPDDDKKRMRQSGGIDVSFVGSKYVLANVGDEGMYERLAALQELQEERINGLPLLQNWKSKEHNFQDRIEDLVVSDPPCEQGLPSNVSSCPPT